MKILNYCLACSLFLSGYQAQAVICKTVDATGVVTYSDMPESACDEPIVMRRIPPNFRSPIQPDRATPANPVADKPETKRFTGYQQFSIRQPKQQAVVRNNLGRVPVRLHLKPKLHPDHRIQLILDGVPVKPTALNTSVILSDVERGQHVLSAQIVDDANNLIKRLQKPVNFTLHKFSALNAPK